MGIPTPLQNLIIQLESQKENPYGLRYFAAAFFDHLIELFEIGDEAYDLNHKEREASLIHQAFGVVNQNLSSSIVVSSIAESLYVSESKLYKTFVNYFGESPKKILTEYKIQLSLKELSLSKKSLDYIADYYGFGNGCQYSKCFKKYMGYSPRSIAKKHLL